jgi:phosphate butyryltransferase
MKQSKNKKIIAVAQAADAEVLKAVKFAIDYQLAEFLLIGDEQKITELAIVNGFDLNQNEIAILHADTPQLAAKLAVSKVSSGDAHVLMKGHLHTKFLLKEVLNREYGLRTGKTLSHVALFEFPKQDKLLFVTDVAMNLEPNVQEKQQIIENAVEVARKIGFDTPKVALLAAVEIVNPKMQATVDAAILTQMQKRGQITGCIVDGPLAFDVAISKKAAEEKGIQSEVAGNADILVVPNIESGNSLYKSFIYFANAKVAAVICGAKAPIVLTSRSDSYENKLYSLVLALLTVNEN